MKNDILISKAISKRILDLCNERGISINNLSYISYLTQSTVQNIVSGKSKNPKIATIIHICYGLQISIQEFFQDDIFCQLLDTYL